MTPSEPQTGAYRKLHASEQSESKIKLKAKSGLRSLAIVGNDATDVKDAGILLLDD